MKKIIATTVLLASMIGSVFALDFSIGAKVNAGINIAANEDAANKVKDSLTKDTVYDLGFGVNANFALFGGLGVQAEANFVTSKASFEDLKADQKVEYETMLLDVPVMLWLNLDLWKLTIGFGVGPNFSTIINQLSDIKNVKSDAFKTGLATGADFKFYFTDNLGLVASARFIMDFKKTEVPIEIAGYETGMEYPTIEFPRRSLYGALGLEWKFF